MDRAMLYYNHKERGSPVSAGDLKPKGSAQGRVAEGPGGLQKKIKKCLTNRKPGVIMKSQREKKRRLKNEHHELFRHLHH